MHFLFVNYTLSGSLKDLGWPDTVRCAKHKRYLDINLVGKSKRCDFMF